jgi:hypothetical protein
MLRSNYVTDRTGQFGGRRGVLSTTRRATAGESPAGVTSFRDRPRTLTPTLAVLADTPLTVFAQSLHGVEATPLEEFHDVAAGQDDYGVAVFTDLAVCLVVDV